MELHDRLKAAREDADLTQAQVAEQTGIARRLLRGRAGWLFMPCGHTKKGRNTPPLFWVQYLN